MSVPVVVSFDEDVRETIVDPNDLDLESADDVLFVQEFEYKWKQFMTKRPDLMPRGNQCTRLTLLKHQMETVIEARKNAESELQSQLAFFLGSRDALEGTYATEEVYARKVKTVIQDRLDAQMEQVNESYRLALETMPFEAFMDAINHKVASAGKKGKHNKSAPVLTTHANSKSMQLIESNQSEDAQLRALQLDNALLTAQITMMEKESERLDLYNESLEFANKFLMQFNVWGMLSKPQDPPQEEMVKETISYHPSVKREPQGVRVGY